MPQTIPTSIRCVQLILCRKHFWASTLTLLYVLSLVVNSSPVQRGAQGSQEAKDSEGNRMRSKPAKDKKPAAHFEADPFTTDTLLWSQEMDNTVQQGKLSLEKNQIRVLSNGSYYIYTQASFHGNDCSAVDISYLSHVVLLRNEDIEDDKTLLSSRKTPCEAQAGATPKPPSGWWKSIFQGGIFELNKGDFIYTVTRGERYLLKSPGQTYIGLYAL